MIATKAATYFVQEQDLPAACRPLLGAWQAWWLVAGWVPCIAACAWLAGSVHGCVHMAGWHWPTTVVMPFLAACHLCVSAGAGDEDEWRQWRAVGDPVVHIELRRWADAFLIAPLSGRWTGQVLL